MGHPVQRARCVPVSCLDPAQRPYIRQLSTVGPSTQPKVLSLSKLEPLGSREEPAIEGLRLLERTRDLVDGLEALLERVLLGQSGADTTLTRGSWLELRAAWQHTLQLATTTTMAPREVCHQDRFQGLPASQ